MKAPFTFITLMLTLAAQAIAREVTADELKALVWVKTYVVAQDTHDTNGKKHAQPTHLTTLNFVGEHQSYYGDWMSAEDVKAKKKAYYAKYPYRVTKILKEPIIIDETSYGYWVTLTVQSTVRNKNGKESTAKPANLTIAVRKTGPKSFIAISEAAKTLTKAQLAEKDEFPEVNSVGRIVVTGKGRFRTNETHMRVFAKVPQ